MKILLADDDFVSRSLVEAMVTRWGYEVVSAGDGETALQLMMGADAPRLCILDWSMPRLEGVEVCRRVRARQDAPYIYILMLTQKHQKRDLLEAMAAGADDYLCKPFDARELKARLAAARRVLDLQARPGTPASVEGRLEEELARCRDLGGILTVGVLRPAVADSIRPYLRS